MSTRPKALVTGASGFIGSRLVRHLVEQGESVKALVRTGSDLSRLADLPPDQVEIAVGDVTASHRVYAALAGCDRMYHVAAVFKMWARRPAEIMDPAVGGTEATLEAARRRGLRKIVVTSSMASVGATAKPEPMNEDAEFSLYDSETYIVAKRKAEELALERARQGLPVVVVCPGAVFGPGDWKPTPTGRVILEFLEHPIALVPESGGLSIVDVDDVVSGHRLAMNEGRFGERYILGGENLSHRELFELLSEITGHEPKVMKATRGLAEMAGRLLELRARYTRSDPLFSYKLARDHLFKYVWADSSKAEKELGYTHRPARQALSRAVRWYLEHGYVTDKAARRVALAPA